MQKTKQMSLGAMIIAIIILMSIIPQLGYITINLVNVTLIHLPVLIIALSFKDVKLSLISGSAFGLSSMINAFIRPTSILSVLLQNPLVSVIPRIAFALVAFYTFNLFIKLFKNDLFASILSIIISVLFHSIAVLSMMYLFGSNLIHDDLFTFLKSIILVNTTLELVVALFTVPIISKALKKVL